MPRRSLRLLLVVAILTGLLVATPSASRATDVRADIRADIRASVQAGVAGAQVSPKMKVWLDPQLTRIVGSNPWVRVVEGACLYGVRVYVQEYGESGVTRLRARFELRGPNDPRNAATMLFSYARTPWYSSWEFPDDHLNYYQRFGTRIRRPGGGLAVWVHAVGERPSFWSRDIVRVGKLGVHQCSEFAWGTS